MPVWDVRLDMSGLEVPIVPSDLPLAASALLVPSTGACAAIEFSGEHACRLRRRAIVCRWAMWR